MSEGNVFVFRVAADNDYIKNEFKQGRLRQGWGNSDSDLHLTKAEWISRQCKDGEANKVYYRRKYNNHRIMLEIKTGDILIIPKLPKPSQFTVCRAAGEYEFRKPDGFDGDDFYHMIPIDPTTVRSFSYHCNEDCENIRAKMRAYQSPLNHVWNQTIRDCAERLLKEESNETESDILNIVNKIKSNIYKNTEVLERLRNLGNREAEKIIERIFEKLGYEQIGKNSYDGKGGDADLIYVSKSVSEFFDVAVNAQDIGNQKIYVQIKNKSGIDSNDTAGIKQLKKRTLNEPNAVKILISTAVKFTEECKKIANENNILLIDSQGFLRLVFKYTD